MGSRSKWLSQTTWKVDPVSGSDSNIGGTSAPLKTLSEFALRTWDCVPTATMTVTIASSLNSNDTIMPNVRGDITRKLSLVGVPSALATGTLSAYTARSGSGSQPTLATISSFGASDWTTYLNKIVEWTDGANFISSVVVADQGSKQAWLSPPINRSNIETPFTNGTSVSVYDLPSLGTNISSSMPFVEYKYLKVAGRFLNYGGRMDLTNCIGDMVNFGGGSLNPSNCVTGILSGASCLSSGGVISINGGYHRLIAAGGSIRVNATPTIKGLQAEVGCTITGISGGSQGTTDFEFCSGSINPFLTNGISGGHINGHGYSYGTTSAIYAVLMQGREGTVSLGRVPNITGSSSYSFELAGTTGSLASLSSTHFSDINGNRIIGPAGP